MTEHPFSKHSSPELQSVDFPGRRTPAVATPMEPVHIPVTVENDSLAEDAVVIARHVRPEWRNCDVSVKLFTDGITNRLVGCYLPDDRSDVVLVRVYGEKTELFIDRQTEKRNMMMMSIRRLAPPLFASFNNGLCYGFTPGTPIDGQMVRDPVVSRLIAQKLARMHFIAKLDTASACTRCTTADPPAKLSPWLFTALERYLTHVPEAFAPDARNGIRIPAREELKQEVSFLKSRLPHLGSPVVFCHNDLLLKNIIYHTEPATGPGVTFIDFEYADYNFQAFDIANHFCEFAGVEVYDPSRYPDTEFQKTWLKNYLLAWKELNDCQERHLAGHKSCNDADGLEISDSDVCMLLKQVEQFNLAAHILWGIWALIQSQHSTINFDFMGYALNRIDSYKMLKQRFQDTSKTSFVLQNGHSA